MNGLNVVWFSNAVYFGTTLVNILISVERICVCTYIKYTKYIYIILKIECTTVCVHIHGTV